MEQPLFNPTSYLTSWSKDLAIAKLNWIQLPTPVSFSIYQEWIRQEKHGGMEYLRNQSPQKEHFSSQLNTAQSVITVLIRYRPHPRPQPTAKSFNISTYAQGEDYHLFLPKLLSKLIERIQPDTPPFEYLIATDSRPILERDLAAQSGLGWIGKNTCLIHPQEGSFFFLAEILTTLKITPKAPVMIPDHCGTCDRCITACPTGALSQDRQLDARKCISYLTIESKDIPPPSLREKIHDWFFGCDICQDVCPWNQKVFRKNPEWKNSSRYFKDDLAVLRFFLTASNKEIERDWGHTPLIRARPRGLRRNALVVAGNLKLIELEPQIQEWTCDPDLGSLAAWAMDRLRK